MTDPAPGVTDRQLVEHMLHRTALAHAISQPGEVKPDLYGHYLCQRHPGCAGCPIRAKTGLADCEGTPRPAIFAAHRAWLAAVVAKTGRVAARKAFKATTAEQIDWLNGVLVTW